MAGQEAKLPQDAYLTKDQYDKIQRETRAEEEKFYREGIEITEQNYDKITREKQLKFYSDYLCVRGSPYYEYYAQFS